MNFLDDQPIVCLITKGEATDENIATASRNILATVELAVDLGISVVQVREKRLSPRPLFELIRSLTHLTANSRTYLLVNSFAGVALAANADGVHLPENGVSAAVVRQNLHKDFIIGVSTHSIEAVEKARLDGADFAAFGPVFETPGKGSGMGLAILSEICARVRPFPVIGLGGIDENNCESVITAGARGIAAIRSLNDPQSLRSIMNKLRK